MTTITLKNVDHCHELFALQRGVRAIVALDVEWTKNYRSSEGLRPFCYSFVRVDADSRGVMHPCSAHYLSEYVSSADEEPDLLRHLSQTLSGWFGSGVQLAGHQLSTDLAIVDRASRTVQTVFPQARERWHLRQENHEIFDTRYDVAPESLGPSRHLVDVCADFGLGVVQPELSTGSMTAIHRRFLERGDPLDRERITTLNIRHSLSTAIVAWYAQGAQRLSDGNLNPVVRSLLAPQIPYVLSDDFAVLCETPR